MYAVIKTGGKQYRVAQEHVLKVEKSEVRRGRRVPRGLMIGGEDAPRWARPRGRGLGRGTVLEQAKGQGLIFRKRRQNTAGGTATASAHRVRVDRHRGA